jgi:hypothetical protein
MDSPIKDLQDLLVNFKEVNVSQLLQDAYSRGFWDGKEITKAEAIEKIKDIK